MCFAALFNNSILLLFMVYYLNSTFMYKINIYVVNFGSRKKSGYIKAIEIHYFVPCRNKIFNKFFLSICASIYFGKGSKL